MTGLRCPVSLGLSLALALMLAGCSDSNPVTPTPTPTPAPPAPTFSVSGTISETAPTTGVRVEGVQVALSGITATATTNADGVFTVSGVPAGTYTLTPSRATFVTQTLVHTG